MLYSPSDAGISFFRFIAAKARHLTDFRNPSVLTNCSERAELFRARRFGLGLRYAPTPRGPVRIDLGISDRPAVFVAWLHIPLPEAERHHDSPPGRFGFKSSAHCRRFPDFLFQFVGSHAGAIGECIALSFGRRALPCHGGRRVGRTRPKGL